MHFNLNRDGCYAGVVAVQEM